MIKRNIIILLLVCLLLFGAVGCSFDDYNRPSSTVDDQSDITDTPETSEDISSGEERTPMPLAEHGIYTFYSTDFNGYLSCEENTLMLSETPHYWEVMSEGDGCYIYSKDSNLLLDIHNAYVAQGTTVKVWQNTGYPTQIWKIVSNQDGSCSFVCSTDAEYCLAVDEAGATLQRAGGEGQNWQVAEVSTSFFTRVNGAKGIVELRLPPDITEIIAEVRLQQWANDLETAYFTYAELTNYIPYETIIVEGYKPCKYMAYVVNDRNVIHMDADFVREDLAKMAVRESDWNFGALHEMGHMFDNHRPWTFEAEVMTDLKVAYVLEVNGACASPSEFEAERTFRGADIINAYAAFGTDISREYNIYACAWKFLKIKEEIGWEPFRQTFHTMQAEYNSYSDASKQQMLENFIGLLSQNSGRDVRSYFTDDEWNTLIKKVNS